MHALRLRPGTAAVFGVLFAVLCGGCPDDGLAGLQRTGVMGSEGRARYVVSFEKAGPDLQEYRNLAHDNPGGLGGYIESKRRETANGQAGLDAALGAVGGRVVERWWMSNQATIELPPAGVASVRAVPGVTSVDPDQLLQ